LIDPEHPDPHELASELAGLLRPGLTTTGLRTCPALLGLKVVAAKAASESPADRAVSAHGIVREAAVRVDAAADGASSTLLGLAPGTRSSLLKARREAAARLLHVNVDHFRKHREEPLIEAVADEIYAIDSAWRLRQSHRDSGEQTQAETRAGIDWLERHQAYRRVWTPIAALRDDLVVLLQLLRSDAEWADIADRVMNQLWRYAQFLRELDHFVHDYGGLWILADVESEVAAADAIRRIAWHVPYGEADNSWLRLTLGETPAEELDVFIDRVYPVERGKEMMTVWLDWTKTCNCELDAPDPNRCEPHRWMSACDEFIRLIDKDWYRVADYYRASDIDIHGLDVRQLWHGESADPHQDSPH
jgi:hypothetical protein